jgi:hypothetical protein
MRCSAFQVSSDPGAILLAETELAALSGGPTRAARSSLRDRVLQTESVRCESRRRSRQMPEVANGDVHCAEHSRHSDSRSGRALACRCGGGAWGCAFGTGDSALTARSELRFQSSHDGYWVCGAALPASLLHLQDLPARQALRFPLRFSGCSP